MFWQGTVFARLQPSQARHAGRAKPAEAGEDPPEENPRYTDKTLVPIHDLGVPDLLAYSFFAQRDILGGSFLL